MLIKSKGNLKCKAFQSIFQLSLTFMKHEVTAVKFEKFKLCSRPFGSIEFKQIRDVIVTIYGTFE